LCNVADWARLSGWYSPFCWDEAKFQSNLEKHKVSFALASILFQNVTVEIDDERLTMASGGSTPLAMFRAVC
jgi:uncharacterized DUF497 family protein